MNDIPNGRRLNSVLNEDLKPAKPVSPEEEKELAVLEARQRIRAAKNARALPSPRHG